MRGHCLSDLAQDASHVGPIRLMLITSAGAVPLRGRLCGTICVLDSIVGEIWQKFCTVRDRNVRNVHLSVSHSEFIYVLLCVLA